MVSGTILIREEWCQEEIENIRYAIKKSRPYGSEKWLGKAALCNSDWKTPCGTAGARDMVPDTISPPHFSP